MKTHKADNEIMKLLNVKEISRIICNTDMGQLTLRLRKGENNYQFVLDAVELPKDLNKNLMEALYPVKEEIKSSGLPMMIGASAKPGADLIKNKRGRPKKNAKL